MKRKTSSIRIYDADYRKLNAKKYKLNRRKGAKRKSFIADILHEMITNYKL